MKIQKVEKSSFAGTVVQQSTNVDVSSFRQPIAKPIVACCPVRVQRKRSKGWKMPENTIYVGRGTQWGNPFKIVPVKFGWHVIAKEGGKEHVILKTDDYQKAVNLSLESYQYWLMPYTHKDGDMDKFFLSTAVYESIVSELKGKNLACWCKIMNHGNYCNCHADILLSLANDIPLIKIREENIKSQMLKAVNG